MALSIYKAVFLILFIIVCCNSYCLWGFIVDACFVCSSFLSFLVLQSSRWRRASLVLWCVVSVLWIFLVVPCVRLSHLVVAFPGHTHLPFGFPVASQAKYFCELDIRFYDEQEHMSF